MLQERIINKGTLNIEKEKLKLYVYPLDRTPSNSKIAENINE